MIFMLSNKIQVKKVLIAYLPLHDYQGNTDVQIQFAQI